MKTTLCLLDLPIDTLLDIFHAADGLDVVALRQTCKALHSIEKEYHDNIWRFHLDRLCVESGFFLPTLKWNAPHFSPSSVVRRAELLRMTLRNNQKYFLERPITSSPQILHATVKNLHSVSFLPGGRFLIFIGKKALRVWDLEVHPLDDPSTPRLLLDQRIPKCTEAQVIKAPRAVSSSAVGVLFRCCTPDAAHRGSQYEDSRRYCQLRFKGIDADSPVVLSRKHSVVIAWGLTDSIHTEARSDIYVCMVSRSDTVVLWNFLEGKYAIWTMPNTKQIDKAFISNAHIFFSCSRTREVLRVNIPSLLPVPELGVVDASSVTTYLKLSSAQLRDPILSASSIQPGHWNCLPWGEISTVDGILSPIQVQHSEGTGLFRSEWRHLPEADVESMTARASKIFVHRFPLDKIWYMESGVQRVGSCRSVVTCGLWETFSEGRQFYAALSQFPTLCAKRPKPGTDGWHVPLLNFPRRTPVTWDFCPLSGKLVVFTESDGECCVHDFIAPFSPESIV